MGEAEIQVEIEAEIQVEIEMVSPPLQRFQPLRLPSFTQHLMNWKAWISRSPSKTEEP